jgi:TrkA domain protein
LGHGNVSTVSVRIEKVDLPGIGTRHDVVTSEGRRLGVISHRNGERELAMFDSKDPDACSDSIHLSDNEAVALSEVLGTSLLLGQFANLGDKSTGLYTEQILLTASSPFTGKTLGATQARTLTKSSIVAILREGTAFPSPTPDDSLEAGDIIVAVGTKQGLEKLSSLLSNGRP